MVAEQKFALSIQSRPLPPLTEGDRIHIGPSKTVKLEPQRQVRVFTGAKINKCDPKGKLIITPHSTYENDLVFSENTYCLTDRNEMTVVITNHSYRFIRVEADINYLFTFEWVCDDVAKTLEPVAEESVSEEIPSEVKEIVEDLVEAVAAEEAVEEEVVSDDKEAAVEEAVVEEEVAPETKEPVPAEPKPAPKRRAQKKKRVTST